MIPHLPMAGWMCKDLSEFTKSQQKVSESILWLFFSPISIFLHSVSIPDLTQKEELRMETLYSKVQFVNIINAWGIMK